MQLEDIKHVAIIGSGTMGNGIAQVFASYGYGVTLIDVQSTVLEKAVNFISGSFDRFIKKGKLTEADKAAAMARIKTTTDLHESKNAQLVIEAVPEVLKLKSDIFGRLEDLCPKETIFASNTSSLPITQLASTTRRPDKFIGMHFMNPVPMMQLIELIRGMVTSNETIALIRDLSVKLGKTPVEVNDYPGFISNRILMPMINEAIYAYWQGVGTVESIDEVMKLGMGHPMGPLTLADFIGLDVCLNILEVMDSGLDTSKYRPCPLLKKMVHAGHLGRKSGRGFYVYA